MWDLTEFRSNEMIRAVVQEPATDGGPVAKRGRGRPRKWASDAERVRAWRAAERARRELWAGDVDLDAIVAKVQQVEAERDRVWQQVLALQAEVRALEQSSTPDASPPAELEAEVIRRRQQADDLAAIVARLTGLGWDHPMFALVDRRARRAAAEGAVLGTSVFDDPEAGQAFVRSEPPPLPPSRPTPDPSRLSHARAAEAGARGETT